MPLKIGCMGKVITSSLNPKIEEIRREIDCEATYAAGRHHSKACLPPNSTTVSLWSRIPVFKARQKGLLTDKDLKKRLKLARKIKHEYNDSLWTEQIAFFWMRFNPADQVWTRSGVHLEKISGGTGMWMLSKGF